MRKLRAMINSEAQVSGYLGRQTCWLVTFYVFKVGGEYMDFLIPPRMYYILHHKIFHKNKSVFGWITTKF